MKAVVMVTMLMLAGLVFAGCSSMPADEADEQMWSDSKGKGLRDLDAVDDDR